MLDMFIFSLAIAISTVLIILEFIRISQMRLERTKQEPLKADLARVKEKERGEECFHFLGYLATHPKNRPVPDECFGCEKAAECVNVESVIKLKGKSTSVVRAELLTAKEHRFCRVFPDRQV